ncbi:hypothetical protein DFH11DRAFT_76418 [Phellopilus nigrolimitatus]|nr:hypothetical protein DFH11DRAFT_76418 [Phellopilus nigrolimitatus]
MSSSPAVTSFFPPASDHRSSVSLAHQSKSYDWAQSHELLEGSEGLERPHSQERPSPKDAAPSQSSRRSGTVMQKLAYSPSPLVMSNQPNADYMKTNPKSAAPLEPYVRDGASDEAIANGLRRAGNRWSFNGSEPKIANWDLADEIGKLSISNGASDGTDGSTTPSKNVRDVLQIHETSPLDTSSSDTSLDSASPQNVDGLNLSSHSRGSSTDTLSSESSARSNAHLNSLKASPFSTDLTKDRPRSFSGAISDVELRRLQNIHTPSQLPESLQDRGSPLTRDVNGGGDSVPPSSTPSGENISGSAQPMFPSLAAYPNVQQPAFVGLPAQGFAHQGPAARHDELQVDPTIQPRQFVNGGQGLGAPFAQVPTNGPMRHVQPDAYRQQMRGVNMFQPAMQMSSQAPPTLLPSPTNFGYPGMPNAHGHHNALSLGNSQQMYDMMVPLDPAIGRTQQTFRAGHQHSASDPASLRDAAALLLGAGMHNMQGMQFPPTPGMYPPMAMTPPGYPNQYFPGAGPQPQYGQEMMGALQRTVPQYGASNGMPTTPQSSQTTFAGSPSPPSSTGPSANNRKLGLYKTELCRSWEEKGTCRYGPKCQFAHGEEEIRKVARHPKYKTEICRTFWVSGSCPYGKRCCFIHTELPASGTPPGAPGANAEGTNVPPPVADGRARSLSTNSDPNDAQTSLLARITAKRKHEEGTSSATTPTAASVMESGASGGYHQFSGHKPPSGALRVDTNVEAPVATKQNKSAYPTFANTSIQALSPGPVTAGPEFGRHMAANNANVVDMNQRMGSGTASANPRHSYTSSEASINYAQQPRNSSGGSSPFGILSGQTESSTNTPSGHGHGHSRSGSSNNWGSFSQKSHLGAGSGPYAHTPSPGNEMASANAAAAAASPWGATEYNANTRHNDRTWS